MHLLLVLMLVEQRHSNYCMLFANTTRHTQDGAALIVYSQLMMMMMMMMLPHSQSPFIQTTQDLH